MCKETRNCAQVHPVSIDHPWDVSTTWLESQAGSLIQLIGHDMERNTPVYIRSHGRQCMSEQKLSHEVKEIACWALRQDCVEAEIWEGYQKMSTALKVPKSTVASIVLNGKSLEHPTLPRAGRLSKLSNRGRRAFVREVTKNTMVTLTELQSSSVEAFMIEWPDGGHSSVKGTWQPTWSCT